MTELPDNILHLPQYQVLGCKSTDDEMHFQVDVPDPIACEECGVQGEFVRFGKRDVPYRDLPIHGKRVTLWVVRRRYTCRACKTTFRPQLPEMVDGFRMTLRLHEYVEKESFNHPYTFVAAQTGLDEKTVRDIFNARAEFLGRWHRFETPRILGIDELYLNKRYRCILTNIEERTLLDLLATRRQNVVTNYLMKLKDRQKVEIVSMDMWNPYRAAVKAVLPQARIVVDKFHVVRMANDALERVRKGLSRNKTSRGGFHAAAPMGLIWNPSAVARRLSAAMLRSRCSSSYRCCPWSTKASPRVSMKYTMRASLCAVAVFALGLSIRLQRRR